MIRTIPPKRDKRDKTAHHVLEKMCIDLSFRGAKKSAKELQKDLAKAGYPVSYAWIAQMCKNMRIDWT
jgi:hypothetical protein